jgi:hypothetical protein
MTSSILRICRKIRYGEPIIVVSGLPRSGTSMTMKMLEAGGMHIVTDEIRTADEDNPKGYFELERIKNLEKDEDKSWLAESRGKAVKIISFLLKDLPKTNNYKVLFMNRHIDEVLASQAKMLARRGESSETGDGKMRELYENHLWKVKYLIKHQTHLETLDINYKEVLENPRLEAKRIAEFTGLDLDVDKMAGAVDEQLYRNRAAD